MFIGIGVHELGHAIGFLHEQLNPIHDKYVEVHVERMDANRELFENQSLFWLVSA
jgi:hypothetical protein